MQNYIIVIVTTKDNHCTFHKYSIFSLLILFLLMIIIYVLSYDTGYLLNCIVHIYNCEKAKITVFQCVSQDFNEYLIFNCERILANICAFICNYAHYKKRVDMRIKSTFICNYVPEIVLNIMKKTDFYPLLLTLIIIKS